MNLGRWNRGLIGVRVLVEGFFRNPDVPDRGQPLVFQFFLFGDLGVAEPHGGNEFLGGWFRD